MSKHQQSRPAAAQATARIAAAATSAAVSGAQNGSDGPEAGESSKNSASAQDSGQAGPSGALEVVEFVPRSPRIVDSAEIVEEVLDRLDGDLAAAIGAVKAQRAEFDDALAELRARLAAEGGEEFEGGELVTVAKDGERLEVHPSTLKAHRERGWRVVS